MIDDNKVKPDQVKEPENRTKKKGKDKPETMAGLIKSAIQAGTKRGTNRPRPKPQVKLSKGDVLTRYYETRNKHILYGLVSFAMTAMFYTSFTSPEWVVVVSSGVFNEAVSAGVWAFLGLLFSITITLLIMHSHTTDRRGGLSRMVAYSLIILLGITFNVFTETASTMDRVDERVIVKSEKSGLFKALTSSIKNSSGASNKALIKAKNYYADAISTARARCKRGSSYNARLCKKWTMLADEYKTAIALHQQGATTEKAETVELAKQASHNTEYAQMIVKIIMEQSGFSFVTSTAIISLFIILTFEMLGVMIGGDYKQYRDILPQYGIDLHRGKEIKYLKKDLKRQKQADNAINKHNLERSKRELQRMQSAKATQSKMQALQAEIRKLSGQPLNHPAMAYGDYPSTPMPPHDQISATSKHKIGFVDTDNKTEPATKHDQPASLPPLTISNTASDYLDMEGLTLEQLQQRRNENVRMRGDFPICPACSVSFQRRTWQDVFCCPEHRAEFNNQVRRLKRASKVSK